MTYCPISGVALRLPRLGVSAAEGAGIRAGAGGEGAGISRAKGDV
jgi:hypothetical protein